MKGLSVFVVVFVVVWLVYRLIGSVFYTYELAKFYDVDYSILDHGLSLNGHSGFGSIIGGSKSWGDVISPTDIAIDFESGSAVGGIEGFCPDVTTKRKNLTISAVGYEGDLVCCWLTDEDQFLVPYKDVGGVRHYMCGSWPYIDHVMQPIAESKLEIKMRKLKESFEG